MKTQRYHKRMLSKTINAETDVNSKQTVLKSKFSTIISGAVTSRYGLRSSMGEYATPSNAETQEDENREMKETIRSKCRTFVSWNAHNQVKDFRKRTRNSTRSNKHKKNVDPQLVGVNIELIMALKKFSEELQRKKKRQNESEIRRKNKQKNSNNSVQQFKNNESQVIILEKKERLKKIKNPLAIVHHFKRYNKFAPTQTEQHLISKLVELRLFLEGSPGLFGNSKLSPDQVLQKINHMLEQIYKMMNMAVDFNEMGLLIILIFLAADVSFQCRDFKRAFYFYHQATIAGEFGNMLEYKISGFIGLSNIMYELEEIQHTVLFLQKALSYAWFINDEQSEIQIYELLGQAYFLNGSLAKAKYFHSRYTQCQVEKNTSATKVICLQIINDYRKSINYKLYDGNINLLFIETLNLPIGNFKKYPPSNHQPANQNNYLNGSSPRKNREQFIDKFQEINFPTLEQQIQTFIKNSPQFKKTMPEFGIQQLFVPSRRYKKNRRQIEFQRSVEYHQIANICHEDKHRVKSTSINIDQIEKPFRYKLSLDKQVENVVKEKPNHAFFDQMLNRIKMKRLLNVGQLKERICKSHLKVKEKKRATSMQTQRINVSVNKAIIDWIDVIK